MRMEWGGAIDQLLQSALILSPKLLLHLALAPAPTTCLQKNLPLAATFTLFCTAGKTYCHRFLSDYHQTTCANERGISRLIFIGENFPSKAKSKNSHNH